MNKNRIRLTESQLHKLIKESVKKVLNESIKGGDMENIVPQSIAEKFGFEPEYSLGNDIELWSANLNQIQYSPKELLRLLGISDFTSYNINGKVRITVKCEKKNNVNTKRKPFKQIYNGIWPVEYIDRSKGGDTKQSAQPKSEPFNTDDWQEQYRDDRGYKFSSKGSGANKQWKREKVTK